MIHQYIINLATFTDHKSKQGAFALAIYVDGVQQQEYQLSQPTSGSYYVTFLEGLLFGLKVVDELITNNNHSGAHISIRQPDCNKWSRSPYLISLKLISASKGLADRQNEKVSREIMTQALRYKTKKWKEIANEEIQTDIGMLMYGLRMSSRVIISSHQQSSSKPWCHVLQLKAKTLYLDNQEGTV